MLTSVYTAPNAFNMLSSRTQLLWFWHPPKQPCSSEVGKQLNLSLHSHHLLALIIRPPWCELPCEQAHLAQNESHSLANRKEVMEALLIEREHVKWIVPATKCGSWGADPSSAKTEGACGSSWHFDWSLVGDPEPPDLAKPCPDSQKNGNWGNRLFSDTKLWGHLIRRESLMNSTTDLLNLSLN